MKRARRIVTIVLGTLALGYVLLCGALFVWQRDVLFPAPEQLGEVWPGARRVDVPDGTFFLFREVAGDGPVVVHFHGNAEQVSNLSWLAEELARRGASLVAVEYPGYPGTKGGPSEDALLAASEAALQHLTTTLKVDRARLVLQGQSVGTGVAVELARRGWGRRLALLSPYTSLPDVGARAFPMFPVRLLMRDRFDSATRASGVKVPTLVVHGTKDQVIPWALGKELSAAIAGARFFSVDGADHNDLWIDDGVRDEVFGFLTAR